MHCLLSTLSSWISIALQPGGCFIKHVYQTSQAYLNYFEQNQQTISRLTEINLAYLVNVLYETDPRLSSTAELTCKFNIYTIQIFLSSFCYSGHTRVINWIQFYLSVPLKRCPSPQTLRRTKKHIRDLHVI